MICCSPINTMTQPGLDKTKRKNPTTPSRGGGGGGRTNNSGSSGGVDHGRKRNKRSTSMVRRKHVKKDSRSTTNTHKGSSSGTIVVNDDSQSVACVVCTDTGHAKQMMLCDGLDARGNPCNRACVLDCQSVTTRVCVKSIEALGNADRFGCFVCSLFV